MSFDLKSFLSGFTKPKMYKGDANSYVAIAAASGNQLGMHLEIGQATVPVHGIPTKIVGVGMRLVEVGNVPVFAVNLGMRGSCEFRDADSGEKVNGFRMVKTFMPIMNYPCDAAVFRAYTDSKVFPELLQWLKGQVDAVDGKLLMSDDELLEALIHTVSGYSEKTQAPMELFCLPGVKPSWVDDPKPKPESSPFGGVDQDGDPIGGDDDLENDGDDEDN